MTLHKLYLPKLFILFNDNGLLLCTVCEEYVTSADMGDVEVTEVAGIMVSVAEVGGSDS